MFYSFVMFSEMPMILCLIPVDNYRILLRLILIGPGIIYLHLIWTVFNVLTDHTTKTVIKSLMHSADD